MSNSKVIWSSPEINKKNKLRNAKLLNDLSGQLLKFQLLFFFFIIFEIYFNLFQKILNFDKQSLIKYKLICKTLLSINIFFLICYAYQIIQAKFTIYAVSNENKFLSSLIIIVNFTGFHHLNSVLKSILFDVLPQLKLYHEEFIQSKIYLRFFKKSIYSEEEKELARIREERRKLLTKSYFPSMIMHQQNNFNDRYMHRQDDLVFIMNGNRYTISNVGEMSCSTNTFHSHENEFKSLSSTPFNNMKAGSINFGGDITPIQSPGQLEHRNVQHVSTFKHPITASPPRIGARFSPGGIFMNKNPQSGVLTEVPINEVWKRLEIDQRLLNDWTFSLRQWIHGTIINRVMNEIDNINHRFIELGITDVVIGESNVQTLRHLTNQPVTPFPTLGALINFLDCSKDQAYVVNRLKELSQGCSLGKFQWDGGSSDARHPWKEHLPNDTMLVLHMLCTYIEVRYAVHSNLHGVRTFSQQFITDNVMNKDINEMKDAFLLYQTSVQPPHFKVIFNQAIYEIPSGRKNLFHCLLVFFYKIYSNEGNFKWLNLGRSGMNINNIFAKLP